MLLIIGNALTFIVSPSHLDFAEICQCILLLQNKILQIPIMTLLLVISAFCFFRKLQGPTPAPYNRASDISRRKKQNFAGFSGANSRDFSGKKSNYERFSGANSKKNRPISREISGRNFAKKQSVKNRRFRWIFGGQV